VNVTGRPGPGETCSLSPLELLHPSGTAERWLLLGDGWPAALLPGTPPRGVPADLVVIAPTGRQARDRRWLRSAVRSAAAQLADGGVIYVLAPPQARRWRALLEEAGLSVEERFVHYSPGPDTYLVPLRAACLRYAFGQLLPMPPKTRRIATALLRLPVPPSLIGRRFPLGFLARQPGASPLLRWLTEFGPEDRPPTTAIVKVGRRSDCVVAMVVGFHRDDPSPSRIAKLALRPRDGPASEDEAARLQRLGPGARAAGALVPTAVAWCGPRGSHAVLESVIPGTPAVLALAYRRADPIRVIGRVAAWLEAWGRATARMVSYDRERLERDLLRPARSLAPTLVGGAGYLEWLARRCETAAGTRAVSVAAHNDLTAYNLLLGQDGELGVVDWEAAGDDAWPLTDFYYAAVDVVLAAGGPGRLEAFRACFAPGGVHAAAVAALEARLLAVAAVPRSLVPLAFHACWLHHAWNEHRRKGRSGLTPFQDIVEWLAVHRERVGR
jgi:hypothetical protein